MLRPHHQNAAKQFRLTVYNQAVRELVKLNKHHETYEDYWAEGRDYIIDANDENGAITIVRKAMPVEDGFIISKIESVKPFSFHRS
ncbi:hypothetical protein RYZ26_16685 [Terasakiella sp. A23]|uniref:hypothetical protein n=1 Tax=Terasakiella sp. FCG-A23 TaxID=3080561 RepID=UPI002952B23F|nr:hypothetical protein [Terasakiella sp. A23]MDV7341247.1 hypothetical protein [Terasakiella sp. A23]